MIRSGKGLQHRETLRLPVHLYSMYIVFGKIANKFAFALDLYYLCSRKCGRIWLLATTEKMLKLRYGAFRSPSGFIKSPLFSWELRSFFLQ